MEKKFICGNCYRLFSNPKTHTPGSFLIEILLWLLFGIPGLIYTIWRIASRKKVCPYCLSTNIHSTTSLRGQEILRHRKLLEQQFKKV